MTTDSASAEPTLLSASVGRRSSVRRVVADVVAMVMFSTALGMTIEIGLSGLTLEQSLLARAMAVPINLLTGRPYGVYRDWLFVRAGVTPSRPVRRIVADSVAFVTFQIPLYAMVLTITGATMWQIATACAAMTAVFTVSGRPYGIVLELCRRFIGGAGRVAAHRGDMGRER